MTTITRLIGLGIAAILLLNGCAVKVNGVSLSRPDKIRWTAVQDAPVAPDHPAAQRVPDPAEQHREIKWWQKAGIISAIAFQYALIVAIFVWTG